MARQSILHELRLEYHREILEKLLGPRKGKGYYSNADSGNEQSKAIAAQIARKLSADTGQDPCKNLPEEQTVGTEFASITKKFLDEAFKHLHHLRPGNWIFSTSQQKGGITNYFQYEHIAELLAVLDKQPELRATLGFDYLVVPDLTIARRPVRDSEINTTGKVVSEKEPFATYTPLRATVNQKNILHASVSCKWTIRSDRSQNTRTEALNLLRNRKGKVPIVVAVVFEPLPTRIASVALGTGDLDCVYHGALHELCQALEKLGNEDQKDMLDTLVQGRRLRDISDLPFDLAT